ncbi:MAG: hypothetical protein IID40_06695 [Planctomycetes bacterium]|nr:hypothetical protein [Planctomycetota bacterium]
MSASDFEFESGTELYRGKGCRDCRHTGYRGRAGIFELLLMTDEMRAMVVKHASATEILVVARRNGIKLMREDGWSKVLTGMTTVEEIQRVTKST